MNYRRNSLPISHIEIHIVIERHGENNNVCQIETVSNYGEGYIEILTHLRRIEKYLFPNMYIICQTYKSFF